MKTRGFWLAIACGMVLIAYSVPPVSGGGDGASSMLLEGLESPLLDDLPAPREPAAAEPASEDEGHEPTAGDPRDQLGYGEDVGQEETNPWRLIGRQMRTAEQLISRRNPARSHRVQGEIIADLERLIEQMRDQQSEAADEMGEGLAAEDENGASGGVGDAEGIEQPGEEDGVEVGETETPPVPQARIRETLDQVWGHLPERVREQMHSGLAEEFLPQYELLIEAYYQRLAEEGQPAR